jgi:hypothetical protein
VAVAAEWVQVAALAAEWVQVAAVAAVLAVGLGLAPAVERELVLASGQVQVQVPEAVRASVLVPVEAARQGRAPERASAPEAFGVNRCLLRN